MQIPLQWGKLKFSVSIKVETRLTNLYGGLDCHIVELPRLPCRRSRVRWSFCDRYKQCDGVSQAKAAIRRTIVKRLTPCVERRMGSRESKILCKLFAAQKSAKINAQGMRRSKTLGHFCTALLRNQGSSMSISSTTQDLAKDGQAASLAVFFVPHICPNAVPSIWPAFFWRRQAFAWQKQESRCIHEEHTCSI